jgi:hypothetical protein
MGRVAGESGGPFSCPYCPVDAGYLPSFPVVSRTRAESVLTLVSAVASTASSNVAGKVADFVGNTVGSAVHSGTSVVIRRGRACGTEELR